MGEKCIQEEIISAGSFKWISVLKVALRENLNVDLKKITKRYM